MMDADGRDACVMHEWAADPAGREHIAKLVPVSLALSNDDHRRRFEPGLDLCIIYGDGAGAPISYQFSSGSRDPASAKPFARSRQLSQTAHGPPSGRGS